MELVSEKKIKQVNGRDSSEGGGSSRKETRSSAEGAG